MSHPKMDAKEGQDIKQDTMHQENDLELEDLGKNKEKQSLYLAFADFSRRDEQWIADMDKRLARKIDYHLLPWIVLMYLTNFLDRNALSQAREGTLEQDLHLHGTQFNTITSILFIGYILLQLPSNLFLTKTRPSLYLCGMMALWGIVSACQSATRSFPGELVCRLFLGAVEAPFFSGCIFLISSWYKSNEITHRISVLYTGVAAANMFGGLIAAGVLSEISGARGIAGWRWLFIIEGTATIAIALIAVWFVPDYPGTTRWLSQEEREYAQWRLAVDVAGQEDDRHEVSGWKAVRLVFTDYKLYLFMLLHHSNLLAQSFTYFFPTIVNSLGFGNIETLLLTVPVWFVTLVTTLLVGFNSSKRKERSIHIACSMVVAIVGFSVVTGATGIGPRYFAMFLMPMGVLPAFQINLGWMTSTFARPLSKRAAAIATLGMAGNCASIYGSYMYPSSDGPKYVAGGVALAIVCFVNAVTALVIRFCLARENKKLEAQEQNEGRSKGFRYIL